MRCAIGFVALVAVLCFSWSPVIAQDVTTYGSFTVLPSFQSLRTMSRSGDAGGTGIFPGLSQSVLNVGYTNLRADASFNQDGNPFLLGIRHKYVLYGVWYEILQRFFLTENLGVLGIANYLQPTSERL